MKSLKNLVLIVVSLFFIGCASIGDFSIQDKIGNAVYKIPMKEKEIEILGTVQVDMTQTSILFIFSKGESTYAKVLEEAKKKFNADDIVNMRMDIISSTFLLVYNKITYRVTAQAIKYK